MTFFARKQHLPKEDIESVLARDHLQHQTPPSNKTTTHLPHPEKETVGMAWLCVQDEQRSAIKNSANVDSRREQKKREAENNVATNGGRTEGCWVNMGHSSKESPRQRNLARSYASFMCHTA